MNAFAKNPRIVALALVVLGAAAVGLIVSLGGMDAGGRTGGRAILLVGIGGIAFGIGLVQLLWPPPVATEGDERNWFSRASWPQKIVYCVAGFVGIVAAAVLQTWASGKI